MLYTPQLWRTDCPSTKGKLRRITSSNPHPLFGLIQVLLIANFWLESATWGRGTIESKRQVEALFLFWVFLWHHLSGFPLPRDKVFSLVLALVCYMVHGFKFFEHLRIWPHSISLGTRPCLLLQEISLMMPLTSSNSNSFYSSYRDTGCTLH